MPEETPRGRYAPSPTGLLHLGNARTALAAWLSVRSQGGIFVLRVEDLDRERTVTHMEEAALQDLGWLGIDWDEGPDCGGPFGPYRQSERESRYEHALQRLRLQERVFPCRLSRRDLQDLASAPHRQEQSPYPPSLRPSTLAPNWYDELRTERNAAVRFATREGLVEFEDRVYGMQDEDVQRAVGDFVLRRRDNVYAYQLAVVVDDAAMGVTEVVRGRDLLHSTARQVQLIEALGARTPTYAHVPLVLNEDGEKLSKRDAGLTVQALREAGVRPEALVGWMAYTLGLTSQPEAISAVALVDGFSWEQVGRKDCVVPTDLTARLLRMN